MNRNQYNLYISNISDITTEECLISYFSQFGKIESYTFFTKSSQRQNASAIITYGLSVDVNDIIEKYQQMEFNGHSLFLRRTLSINRPMYERIMCSNELLVSLESPSIDQGFNEENLRKYFCQYGSIVSCRMVIVKTTFLLEFVRSYSVDSAILDEPHFYNDQELILRKLISTTRRGILGGEKMFGDEECRMNRFPLREKVRRLQHILEAFQLGHRMELKLIETSHQEKIFKYVRLQEDIERMKTVNQSLKLAIEESERIGKQINDEYRTKSNAGINQSD